MPPTSRSTKNMVTTTFRLLQLPEELMSQVLIFLPPRDLVACQLTCSTLNRICSESLVWRRHCMSEYHYWHQSHSIRSLIASPPISVKWKQLLATRKRQDQNIANEFEHILNSQTCRMQRIQSILKYSYDSKDELLRSLDVPADADDYLSRTYWASQTLGCIERTEAVKEWFKIASGNTVPIERAFGAFDLIIAGNPPLTLDEIQSNFDHLAGLFEDSLAFQQFRDTDVLAERALTLAKWLSTHEFSQLPSQERFRKFRNLLISVVLCDHDHEALPIISVAIYCCLAQRLGIDAQLCNFPIKVIATIVPPTGEAIYIDPSGGLTGLVFEIQTADLRRQLFSYGIRQADHNQYLDPASTPSMIQRMANNLEESLRRASSEYETALSHPDPNYETNRPSSQTTLHANRAVYACRWVQLLFSDRGFGQVGISMSREVTSRLVEIISTEFPMDTGLLKEFSEKFYSPGPFYQYLRKYIHSIEDNFLHPPKVQRRSTDSTTQRSPPYRVGQIFRHARYQYTGAIIGWDHECNADDGWINQMGVNTLPRGPEQPFYHVIVCEDETKRYVAEENIILLEHDQISVMPPSFARTAGKYFKRWDQGRKCFVSNMLDEYPED